MKRLFLFVIVCVLISPFAWAQTKTGVDSVEYKILLKSENFASVKKGCELFWDLVEKVAADHNLTAEKTVKSSPDREICFIDTPNFDLNKKGFILRLRASGINKTRNRDSINFADGAEMTLKFRATDMESALIAPVEPASELGNDVSSEEDIVIKAATPSSIFSRSGKVYRFARTPAYISELLQLYPGLGVAKFNESLKLDLVNNIIVVEQRILHGKIGFSKKPTKALFSVWYKKGETKPMIAEFSFKLKVKKNPEKFAKKRKIVDAFFIDLVRRGKLFINMAQTKTGMVYQAR